MSKQALLNVGQIAARKGASELEFAVKKVHSLDASKGGPDGYLKAIIRRVEGIVIDEIRKFYPEDNFFGVESGSEINNSNITWVLKAIDGEINFINGYPHFALSLCSLVDEVPTTAVIIDPLRREEFSASKGSGADMNNGKIRVSQRRWRRCRRDWLPSRSRSASFRWFAQARRGLRKLLGWIYYR